MEKRQRENLKHSLKVSPEEKKENKVYFFLLKNLTNVNK